MQNKFLNTQYDSQDDLDKHIKSGKILGEVLTLIKANAKVGTKLADLDSLAFDYIQNANAIPAFLHYSGFPNSICTSVNDVLIHGVPNNYVLKSGDLLSIDAGVNYQGFYTDAAFSMVIGKNDNAQKIINATNEALAKSIKILKPGIDVKEIGKIIQETAKKYNYKLTYGYTGHGIGKKLHDDPIIFNYYEPTYSFILKENMTIAIEPMLIENTNLTYIDKNDNWSVHSINGCLTAHAEHTILITKNGYKILTENKHLELK